MPQVLKSGRYESLDRLSQGVKNLTQGIEKGVEGFVGKAPDALAQAKTNYYNSIAIKNQQEIAKKVGEQNYFEDAFGTPGNSTVDYIERFAPESEKESLRLMYRNLKDAVAAGATDIATAANKSLTTEITRIRSQAALEGAKKEYANTYAMLQNEQDPDRREVLAKALKRQKKLMGDLATKPLDSASTMNSMNEMTAAAFSKLNAGQALTAVEKQLATIWFRDAALRHDSDPSKLETILAGVSANPEAVERLINHRGRSAVEATNWAIKMVNAIETQQTFIPSIPEPSVVGAPATAPTTKTDLQHTLSTFQQRK